MYVLRRVMLVVHLAGSRETQTCRHPSSAVRRKCPASGRRRSRRRQPTPLAADALVREVIGRDERGALGPSAGTPRARRISRACATASYYMYM